MPGGPAFEAVIAANDKISTVLKGVRERIREIGTEAHETKGELEGVEHETRRVGRAGHRFEVLSGHVRILRTHFGDLGVKIGEVGNRLTEFLPALAGLGTIGSAAGLFELTEKVTEASSTLAKQAGDVGLTVAQIQQLGLAAQMADVPVESLQTGIFRLERNMSMAARGKSKDVAELFKHLHINLKDAHGQVRGFADVLPQLAEAFQHTASAATRADMANALFGRGGLDLINFLRKGPEEVREAMRASGEVDYGFTKEDLENNERYHQSLVKLQASVAGLRNAIGSALAPVLAPVVDMFTKWVATNREWIASGLKENIEYITNLFIRNWPQISSDLKDIWTTMRELIPSWQTFKYIVEGLIALRVISWVGGIIRGFSELAGGIGAAIRAMRTLQGLARSTFALEAAAGAGGEAAAAAGAGGAAAAGEGEAAAAGAGLGAVARRALGFGLRRVVPGAAFVEALYGGGLNVGEHDFDRDAANRNAYLRSLAVPAYPGEPAGPAPRVQLYPEGLPELPRIIVPLPPSGRINDPGFIGGGLAGTHARTNDPGFIGGRGGLLPQLYPGGITGPAAPPVRGQVDVVVRLPNMPQGAFVATHSTGDVRVRVDTGQNHPAGDVGELDFDRF